MIFIPKQTATPTEPRKPTPSGRMLLGNAPKFWVVSRSNTCVDDASDVM